MQKKVTFQRLTKQFHKISFKCLVCLSANNKKYNKICVNSLLEVIKTLLQIIIFALLNKVSELILQQSNFTAQAQPHKIYLTADSRDSA